MNEEAGRRETGRRPKNSVEELLTNEIVLRVERANEHLKSKIKGTVLVKIKGQDTFHMDATKGSLQVNKNGPTSADAVIEIGEHDLLRVASGHLNPQIAMLSDKITIAGNAELAIYFFNLIAPN